MSLLSSRRGRLFCSVTLMLARVGKSSEVDDVIGMFGGRDL